jgi:hypothetical protein
MDLDDDQGIKDNLVTLVTSQQADMILPSPVAVIFAAVGFSTASRLALHRLSRRRSLGLNIRLARPADNAGRQWSAGYGATEAIGYTEWEAFTESCKSAICKAPLSVWIAQQLGVGDPGPSEE